jgi:hypothetical protein
MVGVEDGAADSLEGFQLLDVGLGHLLQGLGHLRDFLLTPMD